MTPRFSSSVGLCDLPLLAFFHLSDGAHVMFARSCIPLNVLWKSLIVDVEVWRRGDSIMGSATTDHLSSCNSLDGPAALSRLITGDAAAFGLKNADMAWACLVKAAFFRSASLSSALESCQTIRSKSKSKTHAFFSARRAFLASFSSLSTLAASSCEFHNQLSAP
jgi:hypothetical protein